MVPQKVKLRFTMKVKVKVTQSFLTLCDPMDYTVHGILQARILEWVAFPFSRGSSQPRAKSRSPAMQVESLPAEPQGKPKNTRLGSLSLLQQIFPTQKSNWGVPHCRWIVYQLNYEGSYNGEKTVSLISDVREIGQLHVSYKNEIRTLPSTIHKDKLKMD